MFAMPGEITIIGRAGKVESALVILGIVATAKIKISSSRHSAYVRENVGVDKFFSGDCICQKQNLSGLIRVNASTAMLGGVRYRLSSDAVAAWLLSSAIQKLCEKGLLATMHCKE